MNDLLRDLAPISDAAWKEIDDQARQALTVELAARKLVDFVGPKGWQTSAMNLGRVAALDGRPGRGRHGGHPPGAAAGRAARPVRAGARPSWRTSRAARAIPTSTR